MAGAANFVDVRIIFTFIISYHAADWEATRSRTSSRFVPTAI